MKTSYRICLTGGFCLLLASAFAQFPGAGQGPHFGKDMAKLFGDNSTFSANLQIEGQGGTTVPGKFVFDQGKTRFEMEMSQMKGGSQAADMSHMKSMGIDMDRVVMISRPDKKVHYLVYPGMKAYAELSVQDADASKPENTFKVELTELGKETLDGHPCVKNKAVVTDDRGDKHESTLWNATDLKKFPIKIEQTQDGTVTSLHFKDVSFSKPEASLFDPPSEYTKYDSMGTMMQGIMMKRMGGAPGMPASPQQP